MMIKLNFENNNHILIKLFDKPAIRRWRATYKQATTEVENFYRMRPIKNIFATEYPFQVIVDGEWNIIKTVFDRLRKINCEIPFDVPDQFDHKQSTLNTLHRYYTGYAAEAHLPDNLRMIQIENNGIFEYERHMSLTSWLLLIDKINQSVHKLENFVHTSTKSFMYSNYPLSYLDFTESLNSIDLSKKSYITRFDDTEQELNCDQLDYSDGPIVTMSRSILGKCFLQSFYEEDDPTCSDCGGRQMSCGGFYIDIDDTRKRVYESSEFDSWLKKYNLNRTECPLEFQLGNVIETTSDLKNFLNFKFINAEFIE